MTEQDALVIIESAVPKDFTANRTVLAKAHLAKAVGKVGRLPGVDFNMEQMTINLTSGQSVYRVGVDFTPQSPSFWNISELYRTDVEGWGIAVVSLDQFNQYARGSSASGPPTMATMHSSRQMFEVWPSPDSNYSIWSYVRVGLKDFNQLPLQYRDVAVDIAVLSVRSAFDSRLALEAARNGFRDISAETLTQWNGETISVDQALGEDHDDFRPDSMRLRR